MTTLLPLPGGSQAAVVQAIALAKEVLQGRQRPGAAGALRAAEHLVACELARGAEAPSHVRSALPGELRGEDTRQLQG